MITVTGSHEIVIRAMVTGIAKRIDELKQNPEYSVRDFAKGRINGQIRTLGELDLISSAEYQNLINMYDSLE